MATTLASIQKQIAALEKQAAAIQKAEVSAAVTKAKELIARFDLSAEDLGLAGKASKKGSAQPTRAKGKAAARPAGVAKYRDPKSGKTWTGNGKPPGWIAGAKNRETFLIHTVPDVMEPAAETMPTAPKPAAKAARKKASPLAKAGARKTAAKKALESKPAEPKSPAASAKKAMSSKSAAKKVATRGGATDSTDATGDTAAATPAPAPGG